jgi:hypothetical protein
VPAKKRSRTLQVWYHRAEGRLVSHPSQKAKCDADMLRDESQQGDMAPREASSDPSFFRFLVSSAARTTR